MIDVQKTYEKLRKNEKNRGPDWWSDMDQMYEECVTRMKSKAGSDIELEAFAFAMKHIAIVMVEQGWFPSDVVAVLLEEE